MNVSLRIKLFLLMLLGAAAGTSLTAQVWDTLATIPAPFTFPVVAAVDGQIHIMGGGGQGGATTLHYAYDPATDTWTSKADVPYAAQQPAGAAANGKIHFFGGGFPNSGTPLADHHIYDPATDTWSQAADLTQPRAIHSSVSVDGTVYTLAGQGVTTTCQTYDAVNDTWINKNSLPDGQFAYSAMVANNNRIFRFAGGGFTGPNDNANIYIPDTDSWVDLPDFPVAIHAPAGDIIGDKIFVVGGYYNFGETDEVWMFNLENLEYTLMENLAMPRGRDYHNVVAIDSCLYVVGGNSAIDSEIRTQLIKTCPFNLPSDVKNPTVHPLSMHYLDGQLNVQLPEDIKGMGEMTVLDASARTLFTESLDMWGQNSKSYTLQHLAAGMYVAQLRINDRLYIGKFVAP